MIPPVELTAAQTTAVLALPDSCEVQRRLVTADGAGGETVVWDAAPAVPCRVAPAGGDDERPVTDLLAGRAGYMVTLPAGSDVAETDRLAVDGRTFEVVSVQRRSWEISRRVLCVEVT